MTTDRMLPGDKLDIEVEVLVDDTSSPGWPSTATKTIAGTGSYGGRPGPARNRIGWYPFDQLRHVDRTVS